MIKKGIEKYNSLSKPLKASFWFLLCGVLTKAVSFLVVPIITRLLSTDDYGLYSLFISWEQIIIIFTSLNLFYNGYTVGISKFEDDIEKYTSSLQGLYTTLTIIWFGIYLIIPRFWENLLDLDSSLIVILFIYLLFSPAYEFWCCRKRYEYEYVSIVITTLAIVFLSPLLMIGFIKLIAYSPATMAIIGKFLIPFIISLAIYVSVFLKGGSYYNKKYWTYSLKFNIPLLPHYLSLIILNQLDRIMIDKMCGYSEVAKYSVVYSASMVLLIVNTAVNNVLTPWMIQHLKNNKDYDFSENIFKVIIIVFLLNFALLCVGPEAITILAPSQYFDAIWMIPPIAMSVVLRFIYQQYVNVEFYFEETKFTSLASLITAFLNILLNYIAIKSWGYIAAAYTTYICYLALTVGHYWFYRITIKKSKSKCIILKRSYLTLTLLIISILLPLFALLYKYTILRYGFLCFTLIIIILKRNLILNVLKDVRKEKSNG